MLTCAHPPSRDYVTGLTDDLALEADIFIMKSLAGAATPSIAIDGWTSPSGKAHFVGVHVQALVETVSGLEWRCHTPSRQLVPATNRRG